MTIQFDSVRQKLAVTTTISDAVLATVLGDSWPLVAYQEGGYELTAGRSSDTAPFHGVAKIKFDGDAPGSYCTSGFAVTNGSQRAMLVPAHCGDTNVIVRAYGSGTSIGTTGSDRHCGPVTEGGDNSDFQFVRGMSYTDDIYLGLDPGFLADILEYGTPAVGAAYRFSGARSYEIPNGAVPADEVVNDVDAESWIWPQHFCSNNGWWMTHLISFSSDSVCDAQVGDSGAPFYARQGTSPVSVRLRGMVVGREVIGGPSGTPGPHCYAIKLSTMTNLSGYWPVTTN